MNLPMLIILPIIKVPIHLDKLSWYSRLRMDKTFITDQKKEESKIEHKKN